ncbi:MAG TPA: glycosyltransferase family 4 protein [bacterium]|nr:glycosyltransferase family 4 protein [bacterium]HPJ71761.1 glycosyltransferase family 4 protein [bacterium]HPQ66613.1 glycosyltransferase family 4 protein [bacterium]
MPRKKLRFCLVTTFYPPFHPGGCGLHVYHLANLLAADGHEVVVAASAGAHAVKISERRPGEYPHHPGVRVVRVEGGRGEALATYLAGRGLKASRALRGVLEREHDVVHYHNISLFGGIRSLGWGSGLKLFTQHTYWLLCPSHYLWKHGREPCRRPSCLSCLLRAGKPPAPWRWGGGWRRLLEGVDSLIMPCRYMLERHRAAGFGERMDRLPYFVAPVAPSADAAPGREAPPGPFFLLVTRLERYKGPRLAVEAFMRTSGDVGLVVVGTGSMAGELRALAAADGRVKFLDYVAPRDLEWYYAHATALLAPSLWPEMGNQTVLQAASCGTPALASRSGCLPELVGEHGAGLMFEGPEELTEAMERIRDPDLRRRLGDRARAAFRAEYTPEVFLRRYYRLIDDLTGEGGGA